MSKVDGPSPPYQQQGYPFAPLQGSAPPKQQGYTSPPQGYAAPQNHQQSSNVVVITQPQQQVVAFGRCRACGVGQVSENFTILGCFLAVCFFPLGVLCCLLLTEKRCDRCGALY